jgi:tRNA (adenine57-N1/adenine58-N1)-methyltransferase
MTAPFTEHEVLLLTDGRDTFIVRLVGPSVPLGSGKGAISTASLLGHRPGDRVRVGSREFVLMRPDTIDHLEALERGPQIILPKDSSRIAFFLGVRSGDTVIEAGAGSGGLTLALLNSVWPTGRVITYDVRQDHLDRARSNIGRTDMAGCWEGRIADVREGVPDREADAIAIDIPDPENAVTKVVNGLKVGGRICCYVPTMNQVERCVLAMRGSNFSDVVAVELIERRMSVKEGAVRPDTDMLGHTGYMITARRSA